MSMKKKRFKANLFSIKEIEKLRADLIAYRDDLPRKCEEIVRRLTQMGEEVALVSINESPQGKMVTLSSSISAEQMGCKGVLIATGAILEHEGYEPFNVLFAIEFGAGIRYNKVPNPKASELGFGVGTFPNQTHAFDEDGWWFKKDDGTWVHSNGIKATMPMYKATMEIVSKYQKIVREVFADG